MKRVKKVLFYVGSTVLIFICLLLLLFKIKGIQIYSIVSGSMEPSIQTGSLLFHQMKEFNTIETGDVITYKMENTNIFVTHRVVEVDQIGKRVLCKGDANINVDASYIREQQYKGSVLFHVPYVGYVALFLNSSIGKVLCYIMITLLLISLGMDLYKKRKGS